MSPIEAGSDGIRQLEHAGPPGGRIHIKDGPLGPLLLLASAGTLMVAVWLFVVITTVLPARDPAHIPMWRWIALAFLGYSGLSLAFLCARRRVPVLGGALLVASVAAVGAGAYGIFSMNRSADHGGHFEGYIVIMGMILCFHGVTAILLGWKSRKRGPG